MARTFFLALPFVLCAAACGAVAPSAGDSSDGGARDSSAPADGGCPQGVPTIACINPCTGGQIDLVCTAGSWVCPPSNGACAVDGGVDSSPPRDASPANDASIVCGGKTCDALTQYCLAAGGGAQPPDGGTNMSYTCVALPAACDAGASCACLTSAGCMCNDDEGRLTVSCLYP